MGHDARRKQKQKLKRKQKRTSQRRALGQSPYGKLKHAGDMEACYINEDWEDSRIASILALRKVPGGYAMETSESRAALTAAAEQVAMFMRQFNDPADMMRAIGLDQEA